MATPATGSISKNITSSSGVDTAYWLISYVGIDVALQHLEVTLAGYVSVAGQAAGDTRCDSRLITLQGSQLAGVLSGGGALLSALATWIVANDAEFSGGTVN